MQSKLLTSCNSIGRSVDGYPSLVMHGEGDNRIQAFVWRPHLVAASCMVAWDHRGIFR